MPQLSMRQISGALITLEVAGVTFMARAPKAIIELRCPIRSALGFQCPGCGSSRCLQALGVGDLSLAMRHNPILTIILISLASFSAYGLTFPSRAAQLLKFFKIHQNQVGIFTILVIVVFAVVRNFIPDIQTSAFFLIPNTR